MRKRKWRGGEGGRGEEEEEGEEEENEGEEEVANYAGGWGIRFIKILIDNFNTIMVFY